MTESQLERLAEQLGTNWKRLATELGYSDDDVKKVEGETEALNAQAKRFLLQWQVSGFRRCKDQLSKTVSGK